MWKIRTVETEAVENLIVCKSAIKGHSIHRLRMMIIVDIINKRKTNVRNIPTTLPTKQLIKYTLTLVRSRVYFQLFEGSFQQCFIYIYITLFTCGRWCRTIKLHKWKLFKVIRHTKAYKFNVLINCFRYSAVYGSRSSYIAVARFRFM